MALLKDSEEILMSGEELFRRPDLGPCELVNGRVVPLPPAGYGHGLVEARLTGRLLGYAEDTRRGEVTSGEVGIYIRRNPDTVRGADIAFISNERLARRKSSSYLDVAPELVVEVLSPDDRWSEVTEKIHDYFAAGVDRVWVLDSKAHKIFTYRSPTEVEQFGEGEVLTDEGILPGFRLVISDLFLFHL
ncbi:MAG TPA: Uma2 family endonuclease [Thermoanaerobaculia bacterium]|jgi:Uma2 family endonuclease